MILKFLKTYWAEIAVGLTLVFLGVALQVTRAERDAAIAERNLAQTKVAALSQQIENQNAGIRALAEAAAQNREVYLAGLKAAEKKAVRLTVKAEDVLALPAPTNPDDACEAAAGVLREVTR